MSRQIRKDDVTTALGGNLDGLDASGATLTLTSGGVSTTLAHLAVAGTTPYQHGAFGDGASHPASAHYPTLIALKLVYPFATSLTQEMDFLGWQAALNAGGLVTCSGQGHFIMCNAAVASMTPLTVIAGQSWVEGYGAILDFSAMRAQVNTTHLMPNWNFVDNSAWMNSTDYTPGLDITLFTFGSGHAVATDPPSFVRFGQQITLQPGNYTLICTFTATLGASYATGNVNQPYGSIGFWEFGPGDGGNWTPSPLGFPGLADVITAGPAGVTVTLTFNFNVASTWTTWPTFTGGGYANWEVTRFDIIPAQLNCALWLTRDGSAVHYNLVRPLRGLEIVGNDRKNTAWIDGSEGTTGVFFESFVIQDGNMTTLQDCSIHGFGSGMWFHDGAYLTEVKNTMIYECDIGLYFNGGVNSGENLRFYAGGVFNCLWGIMNPHSFGEISFYGTALDYCFGPISNNAGKIELHGCHVENNLSETPLFHCTFGQIMMYGGIILGVAPHVAMSSVVPPIKLESSNALFTCFGTALWNLVSGTGEFVSGAGTFRTYGWINQGNAGLQRPGPAPVLDPLGRAGKFEPVAGVPVVGLDPSGIYLEGGVYSTDTAAVITSRWVADLFAVTLTATHVHSGTLALECAKTTTAGGANHQICILVPVERGQDVTLSFWWLAPNSLFPGVAVFSITLLGGLATVTSSIPHGLGAIGTVVAVFITGASPAGFNGTFFVTVTSTTTFTYAVPGGTVGPATGTILWSATVPLYARIFWVQQISTDSHGRPVFGPGHTFRGENDIYMPLCGSPTWSFSGFGTQYDPPTTDISTSDGPGAPIWATHLALLLDAVSLPAMTFHIDDVTAYVI